MCVYVLCNVVYCYVGCGIYVMYIAHHASIKILTVEVVLVIDDMTNIFDITIVIHRKTQQLDWWPPVAHL